MEWLHSVCDWDRDHCLHLCWWMILMLSFGFNYVFVFVVFVGTAGSWQHSGLFCFCVACFVVLWYVLWGSSVLVCSIFCLLFSFFWGIGVLLMWGIDCCDFSSLAFVAYNKTHSFKKNFFY